MTGSVFLVQLPRNRNGRFAYFFYFQGQTPSKPLRTSFPYLLRTKSLLLNYIFPPCSPLTTLLLEWLLSNCRNQPSCKARNKKKRSLCAWYETAQWYVARLKLLNQSKTSEQYLTQACKPDQSLLYRKEKKRSKISTEFIIMRKI